MIKIPFDTTLADQKLTVSLDGTDYTFRVRWNDRSELWYLSLYDELGSAIFEGMALVLGIDYFDLVVDTRLPQTEGLRLFRMQGAGECGRDDLGNNCILIYSGD